jgi:hypothetical protein
MGLLFLGVSHPQKQHQCGAQIADKGFVELKIINAYLWNPVYSTSFGVSFSLAQLLHLLISMFTFSLTKLNYLVARCSESPGVK